MTAAEVRAAKRDYWTNPIVTERWQRIEYTLASMATAAILILGSLNF